MSPRILLLLLIITLLILFNLKWKYWKKDKRGYHVFLLLLYYFVLFADGSNLLDFPMEERIIRWSQVVGAGLFFGFLLPYLISLCFPKERRGRVFNNNALCMNYVVFVYAIDRLQINWFSQLRWFLFCVKRLQSFINSRRINIIKDL